MSILTCHALLEGRDKMKAKISLQLEMPQLKSKHKPDLSDILEKVKFYCDRINGNADSSHEYAYINTLYNKLYACKHTNEQQQQIMSIIKPVIARHHKYNPGELDIDAEMMSDLLSDQD